MRQLKAIILAAGEGSRMKSKKPKVLHEILNKSMVDYVIETAKGCGAEEVCVVVGHKAEEVKAGIRAEGISFALQAEQKGQRESTLRFSFSEENTFEEVDYCLEVLGQVLPMLRRYSRH